MSHKWLHLLLAVVPVVCISCKSDDPITVVVTIPIEACGSVDSSRAWATSSTYNMHEEIARIGSSYTVNEKSIRVSSIVIRMKNAPPVGSASGDVYAHIYTSGPHLLSFTNTQFTALASGITWGDSTVIVDHRGLDDLLSYFRDPRGLPQPMGVFTNGTTSVSVAQTVEICAQILLQLDGQSK